MNFEQIIIRLGVDATAVKTGLGKAGAMVKAWGASLVQDFKGDALNIMKGFVGAEAITSGMEKFREMMSSVSERILKIKKDASDTGLSTNFIQELYRFSESSGVPFEALEKNLLHLNEQLGAAKSGSLVAREKLMSFGLANKDTAWNTLNLHDALGKLRAMHVATADAAKNNYREEELLGRGYKNLIPLLSQTEESFNDMDGASFFSKINEKTINTWTGMFGAKVQATDIARSTFANSFSYALVNGIGISLGTNAKLATSGVLKYFELKGSILNQKEAEAEADAQDITNLEKKNELAQKRIELEGELKDLTNEKIDRDKMSVDEMDAKFRQITGQKSKLEMFHTVTPIMRQAHNIKTLEERAKIQMLRGDESGANQLQSEADQIRASNNLLKATDRNPMEKTELKLQEVKLLLEPCARAAVIATQ